MTLPATILHVLRTVGLTITRSEATDSGWTIEATREHDGHRYTIRADDEYLAVVRLAELEGFDLEE